MALTNNNLAIIKALTKNDIHSARIAALASLAEDKSKKNESVIDHYRRLLIGNASVLTGNMPADLQTVLVGSAPESFEADRYYVRPAEAKVISDVVRMKAIADKMSEMKIPYRNTTLLYGESGTGKTEMGRYIAYRLNLPFFYISFASTIDSYMGSTAKNIHKVFEFCNSIPCVLMLDEVDCIATRRVASGSRGADGELERTTVSIMQELDRLPNHVTLIAATNRLDMVDEALMRRFSIKHEIKNMAEEDLQGMINQFLQATHTEKYVSKPKVNWLSKTYKNPGQLMPELIRMIGTEIYEECKDEIQAKEAAGSGQSSDIWEVTYTWRDHVSAETEQDAIALVRNARTSYAYANKSGEYTARRVDINPAPKPEN